MQIVPPTQLPLFDSEEALRPSRPERGVLDAASEGLLRAFAQARDAERAHPRSVARDLSQLRALVRASREVGGPDRLETLVTEVRALAWVLREPPTPIARSTGRARLIAAQRFIAFVRRRQGCDPSADLARLDMLLPRRKTTGWHDAGTMIGGTPTRVRRRGPTLDAADLRRLVDAAGMGEGRHAGRDRALVALQCFSGLRIEEIVRLRWEDLTTELTATGYYGLTAAIVRKDRYLRLPLPGPAAEMLAALAESLGGSIGTLTGPVLRASGPLEHALSYRTARDILRAACRRAGLPPVETVELRAACAHWLCTQGLSIHEVAAVLGIARVRTVDRLLQRHAALDAQRCVREMLVR
jgi:integrase